MRILEEDTEYKCRCNHCGIRIEFTLGDVFSTYRRGLEMSDGWIDGDCLWHYVTCPKCGKYIAVDSLLENNDKSFLQRRYDNTYNID